MWYTMIKRYYDSKHPSYTNEGMKNFVKAGMLTETEYQEITGVEYTA
jgi:uncharacterized XkdX family phage protein